MKLNTKYSTFETDAYNFMQFMKYLDRSCVACVKPYKQKVVIYKNGQPKCLVVFVV